MKKLFTLILLVFWCQFSFAQDVEELAEQLEEAIKDTTYWDSEFSVGLNFNQAAFSGNWKAGGVSSIAFGSIATGKANYAKDKFSWDNQAEFIYGLVKNDGQELRKSNDRIFFDSKVGYQINDK